MDVPAIPVRGALDAMRTLATAGFDLLYPERCVHCGRFGMLLCEQCARSLDVEAGEPRCPVCDSRWDQPGNCPRCFGWDALESARTATFYEGAARDLVRALKYRHVRGVAAIVAARIVPLLAASEADLVLPIPLHRSRQRQRGFNQAQLIARQAGLPSAGDLLIRQRRTRAQFGLSHAGRARNVAGAFAYRGPSLQGKRVLLLDDVVTTGATANECARVLRNAGAASVSVLGFARANYRPTQPHVPLDL